MNARALGWAWSRKAGHPLAKLVLLTIADHLGADGTWEYDYQTLCARAEADNREVEAAMEGLEQLGLIEVDRCVVRLRIDAPGPPAEAVQST